MIKFFYIADLLQSYHVELDRRVENGEVSLWVKFHNWTPRIVSDILKTKLFSIIPSRWWFGGDQIIISIFIPCFFYLSVA